MRPTPFAALFLTQALGALNDNLFKNAIVVLVVFRSVAGAPVLVAAAGGLFILPYLLFSASAGQLADRMPKPRLIRLAKAAELALMGAAAVSLLRDDITLMFLVLAGLGTQAAVFGPAKYAVLPELLPPARLLAGNALVEAATFLAILLGTLAGGLIVTLPDGPFFVAALLLIIAAAGLAAALALPPGHAASPRLRLDNPVAATTRLLRTFRRRPAVWPLLPALSWFWALGAVFLAEIPVLVQTRFGGDNQVVTLLLAAFSVGVGLGAMAAGRLGPGSLGAVRPAGLALSLAAAAFVACAALPNAQSWQTPRALLASPPGLAALIALLATAAAGGCYSVPLYAALQRRADPAERARAVAANNVMNAAFMTLAALALALLAAAGLSPLALLALAAALNVPAVLAATHEVALTPALGDER